MLFADNTYEMIHIYTYIRIYIYSVISSIKTLWFPLLIYSIPLLYVSTPLFFTYLEIPFLAIMVRISIHSRPWLVINCSPLAS
jgi:hypothetical protein